MIALGGKKTVVEQLQEMPDDFDRVLAIVAHPDDLAYGASSAIAVWTDTGKSVTYLLVTRGEAGIDVGDAGNRWVFAEQIAGGLQPWAAARVAIAGSSNPTHAVAIESGLERGIASEGPLDLVEDGLVRLGERRHRNCSG